MPRIHTLPRDRVPAPPAPIGQVDAEIVAALERLGDEEVLRLAPDRDESLERLKAVVEHVAVTHGMCAVSWTDGREGYLYVRRTG